MQAGHISLDAGEQGADGETAVAPESVDADSAGTPGGVGDIGDGGELRRALRRRNVTYTEVDIWTSREAAAAVRAVADGNETVPTVHVGGQWLVNPRAATATATATATVTALAAADSSPRAQPPAAQTARARSDASGSALVGEYLIAPTRKAFPHRRDALRPRLLADQRIR